MTHRPIAGSALGRPDDVAMAVVVQELLVENA